MKVLLAMFTLCWIAFATARKPYRIWLLFTHKSGNFIPAVRKSVMLVPSKVKMSGSAKKSEQEHKQQNVIFNTNDIF